MKYHAETGFPRLPPLPKYLELYPTRHAQERLGRYKHRPRIPAVLDTTRAELVSVDVDDGEITKALLRLPYSRHSDLSLVVDIRTGNVVTAWKNAKDDRHATLDKSRYCAVKKD